MVFKIAGSIKSDRAVLEGFIRDVVLLRYIGIHPIFVHEDRLEISEAMKKFDKKAELVGRPRVTDRETLGIARMVPFGNVTSCPA